MSGFSVDKIFVLSKFFFRRGHLFFEERGGGRV